MVTGERALAQVAADAAESTLGAIRDDGYLDYADHASGRWTDCFHHLYVMASLSAASWANPLVDTERCNAALASARDLLAPPLRARGRSPELLPGPRHADRPPQLRGHGALLLAARGRARSGVRPLAAAAGRRARLGSWPRALRPPHPSPAPRPALLPALDPRLDVRGAVWRGRPGPAHAAHRRL